VGRYWSALQKHAIQKSSISGTSLFSLDMPPWDPPLAPVGLRKTTLIHKVLIREHYQQLLQLICDYAAAEGFDASLLPCAPTAEAPPFKSSDFMILGSPGIGTSWLSSSLSFPSFRCKVCCDWMVQAERRPHDGSVSMEMLAVL